MRTSPIYAALAQLENSSATERERDVVTNWALLDLDHVAARLLWAAGVATNGQPLPLDANDLEDAYNFDAARPTVLDLATALLTPHESEAA
jgi:hypothetical protein